MRRLLSFGFRAALLGSFLLLCLLWSTRDRVVLDAPEPTRVLTDRYGAFLGAFSPKDAHGYWILDELPARVVAATLAIEDRRYYDHWGVDSIAVGRALWQNIRNGRRISGASTLTMQVARMQHPAARTWSAKITEAATSIQLFSKFGRAQILAHYLRLAPYANNVRGIGYAAYIYFDRSPNELSWAQAAYLVGIPQSPARMNPYSSRGHARAQKRAARILDLLHDAGTIDTTTHLRAQQELKTLHARPKPRRPDATLHAVFALDAPGKTPLRKTTLDLELQHTVQATLLVNLKAHLAAYGAEQAAAMVIERDTHAVRAAIGSIGWHTRGGAIDFTRIPRDLEGRMTSLLDLVQSSVQSCEGPLRWFERDPKVPQRATAALRSEASGPSDAWVFETTPRYFVGLWVGRPDGQPMLGITGERARVLMAPILEHLSLETSELTR